MSHTARQMVAEFVGTFFLCFLGIAAIVAEGYAPGAAGGSVGIAAAHGVGLAIGITVTMAISGGHLNPAVTLGLWSIGVIKIRKAGLYILAQLAGGVAAAFLIKSLFPPTAVQLTRLGTPRLGAEMTTMGGVSVEAIVTFLLAFAVMGGCVDNRAHRLGGFPVGLLVMCGIWSAGSITGAAFNPARAFGPALASGTWTAQAVYWIGPIIGAIVAMQLYDRLLAEKNPQK